MSGKTSSGLREARDEEIEAIVRRAEKHLPHTLMVQNTLHVGFQMKLMDRSRARIYIPANDSVPFFVIITQVIIKPSRNNLTIYWDPKEIPLENAKTLMNSLPDWDWEQPVLFVGVPLRTLQEVEKIMLGEGGLCNGKLHLEREDGHHYLLSDEHVEHKIKEEEIFQAKLSPGYAPFVYEHWPFSFETVEGIEHYMRVLPTKAAFAKADPSEECGDNDLNIKQGFNITGPFKPVAWTLCRAFGEIGFTYTLPEYRNKGLCGAITLALAKDLIKMNILPFVHINDTKAASVKAHENIGFRKYCAVGYHAYVPDGWKFNDI